MKNFIKNFVISILVISLFGLLLSHADQTRQYAFLGLNIWYEHMLPALLPFMILSGLMIDLRLEKLLVKPFSYILRPLFRISDAGIYTLIMGFLCGFPMGAKIVSYEFQKNNLTKKEAEYLLSFCNNFGPAYCLSKSSPAKGHLHPIRHSSAIWPAITLHPVWKRTFYLTLRSCRCS